jgi:hypothetical protein
MAAPASRQASLPSLWRGGALPSLPPKAGGGGKLSERFGVNPFSTLDAKQGAWQRRKKEWAAIFDSSLGRDEALLGDGMRRLSESLGMSESVQ